MSDWVDDPNPKDDGEGWADDPPAESKSLGERIARGTLKALPAAGALFGGAAGTLIGSPTGPGAIALGVGGAGLGAAAGESLKNIGEHFLGDEKTRADIYGGPAKAALEGMTYEMGGQAIGAVPGLIKNSLQGLSKPVGNAAEKFAVNATGATGAQSAKFSDDAGRQLLDRKLVRFGDNASNVAKRTSSAMDDANAAIDKALSKLRKDGVEVDQEKIIETVQRKINDLASNPANDDVASQLRKELEVLRGSVRARNPKPQENYSLSELRMVKPKQDLNYRVGIDEAEEIKRAYSRNAGNWMNPEKGMAGKQMYQIYREAVEDVAQAADPATAGLFKEGKKSYGLLAPIQEAAERRAATLNQSPLGGLLDVATAGGAGATVGGPVGMITGAGAAVGRRMLSPRISSTAAVSLDNISKALMKSPQMAEVYRSNPSAFKSMVQMLGNKSEQGAPMSLPRAAEKKDGATNFQNSKDKGAILQKTQSSKYGQVLQNAADKGDQSFAAANYVLSQRDPEYRKLLDGGGD